MLPSPAAIQKPPRETTKKYPPAVKTKPRLSLEQSRWPLNRRATDNQKYKIPSHSLIALAQSRGRRRDGQKKRLRSTKPLAHSKATALQQKMLKCSPGPCEAGVFASIVGGHSGVFGGTRGIRLAVGFLDGLAVPDRNANVAEFQYVFYCFLQRSLGPRRG